MLLTKIFSGVSYRLVLRQWLVDGRSRAVWRQWLVDGRSRAVWRQWLVDGSSRAVWRQWLVDGRSKAVFISMMHMKVCTIILTLELRGCVKDEVDVLGSRP